MQKQKARDLKVTRFFVIEADYNKKVKHTKAALSG